MANNMILNMIRLESKDQKIPQKRLCYGICAPAYLSQCVRQEMEMDKLTLEALLQRLGISTRRYTFVLREREYDLFELRERIRQCIWNSETEPAEAYIEEYLGKLSGMKSAKNLHLQVMALMRSYILALKKVSYEEQLKNVIEGLSYTDVRPKGIDFDTSSYSEIELLLLLRAAMILEKLGQKDDATHIYEKFYKAQMKRPYKDNEFSHVFAKVNYEMAKNYFLKQEYAKALEVAEYGIKMLADGNKILYLWELMEIYLKAEEKVLPKGAVSEKKEIYKYYPSVKNVIKSCYKNWNADEHCPMYYEYKIYSLKKMLVQRRKLFGETQESISRKSNCNYATIERVERGQHNPQNKTRYSLLNEVGLPIEKCYYMLITDNMKVKRKYFDYMVEMEKGNIEEAKTILNNVKSSIDLSITINKQAMALSEFEIHSILNQYTPNIQLRREIGILQQTLPEKYLESKEGGLLYGNEENIVRRIIKNYELLGDIKEAISLTKRVLSGYTDSKAIGDEFVGMHLGFAIMLESMLANSGDFESADMLIEENICKCVQHDLAGMLVFWLYDKVWNTEKQNKKIVRQDICMLDVAIIIAALKDYQKRRDLISCYREKLIQNMKDSD